MGGGAGAGTPPGGLGLPDMLVPPLRSAWGL